MRRSVCRYPALVAIAVLTAGCADGDRGQALTPPSNLEPRLIDSESSTHHFGVVISPTSRKLEHRYRLANSTGHDVRIVELVNRKPCCGELHVGKTTLRPGDETEVVVTLSVRQEFGDVVHDTVVLTEPPQSEVLVLRTMAKAVPSIRIEEVTPVSGLVLLSSEKPR
jgi:hypothetical protein